MRIFLILIGISLLVSCSSLATQPAATETSSPVPSPTPVSSPLPTSKPTKTAAPTGTPILGFEDWIVFNPAAVDIHVEDQTLVATLKYHVLWFMTQRGELIYKLVSGDFKITADVHTSKNTNLSQPPGGDGSVQLGGVMARNGDSGRENYVFIVVGDDGDGLSIESKNTQDSMSKYKGPAWDSADAALRLCRVGQTFNLYKRHIASKEPWQLADSFERPDLPDELQVGVNLYTDSQPDLQVRYQNIDIQPVSSAADCETD